MVIGNLDITRTDVDAFGTSSDQSDVNGRSVRSRGDRFVFNSIANILQRSEAVLIQIDKVWHRHPLLMTEKNEVAGQFCRSAKTLHFLLPTADQTSSCHL